jgi:hypothetical protein
MISLSAYIQIKNWNIRLDLSQNDCILIHCCTLFFNDDHHVSLGSAIFSDETTTSIVSLIVASRQTNGQCQCLQRGRDLSENNIILFRGSFNPSL